MAEDTSSHARRATRVAAIKMIPPMVSSLIKRNTLNDCRGFCFMIQTKMLERAKLNENPEIVSVLVSSRLNTRSWPYFKSQSLE